MADQREARSSVYERVTNQIVQAIEAGTESWVMPWHSVGDCLQFPNNIATGKQYRGINVLSLWAASFTNGYESATWGTFNQWSSLGHRVRKGEKASLAVFWKPIADGEASEEDDDAAEQSNERRWILRSYLVFNAAQIDGYTTPELPVQSELERIEHADQFFAALGADVRHGGNRAFYNPSSDHIQLPPFHAFVDPIAYYATRGHEHIHWSGAEQRLHRDLSGRFGSKSYAAEELIAELGAAFLAADLNLTLEPRPDHAAYIQTWLSLLKEDHRAIFTAATHAQRALDYLHSLLPVPDVTPEDHIEVPKSGINYSEP